MSSESKLQVLPNNVEAQQANGQRTTTVSRRRFLQILGSTPALAACADSPKQNILPFLKGDETLNPGVAVWFSSTCNECSAGCGIRVRTREGRAVKIEGNPDNPINRGGLCALGQSSLQNLYDPDRVRQPLQKDGNSFKPISWDEAYARITEALQKSTKKRAFVTDTLSGSIERLVQSWSGKLKVDHFSFNLLEPVAIAEAAKLVFGVYGIPQYHFDRAEVVLNFGTDFLETWISPVEYARAWASSRKSAHPLKLIHIEPRLSLTGANADKWIMAAPGSETHIALAILKQLLQDGRGQNLSSEVLQKLKDLTGDVDFAGVEKASGVSKEQLLLIAETLSEAQTSLIIAGGAAGSTNQSLALQVLAAFMNLVLGNVGTSLELSSIRSPKTSLAKFRKLVSSMEQGEVDILFTHSANPVYGLSPAWGYTFALAKVPLKVSFSSQLDETAKLADLILPAHTSLESWGDSQQLPGVLGLQQPVMAPVFDTKALGDILIEVASKSGIELGQKSFYDFVRAGWDELYKQVDGSSGFENFWRQCVERGGYFESNRSEQRIKVEVSSEAFRVDFKSASFEAKGATESDPVLYPFPSVKSFDGRAANRPWLQELPDPIAKVYWNDWVEIHPETAKAKGIKQGDLVLLTNHFGQLSAPALISEYVHKNVVAVPLGYGHSAYGRYAEAVGSNVLALLPASMSSPDLAPALLTARVGCERGRGKPEHFESAQGSDSQHDRHLARTQLIGEHSTDEHAAGHASSHSDPPQMYTQREHPLYRWGMVVDLAACTGCSACVVACYAENNIPVVGRRVSWQGREMSWLRIERYYDGPEGESGTVSQEELKVSFLPMMCQHCGNAPCEPVCPVYATYHNEEGINAMMYNRCVGTRYCGNNCSYKVRRFNWFEFDWPEPLNWQLNPDVVKRAAGVMEKCTFCVQRILEAKDHAKDEGRLVHDGEIQPACVQSCPTQALSFGNLKDPKAKVTKLSHGERAYKVLDHHLNTQPAIVYLEDLRHKI